MTKYIFHTAGTNERWDLLAYMYYKNCYKIKPIIEANPHILIEAEIKEGTILKIPINEENEQSTENLQLPVWKRQ